MTFASLDCFCETTKRELAEKGAALKAASDLRARCEKEEFARAKTISICEWCLRIADRLIKNDRRTMKCRALKVFEAFSDSVRKQNLDVKHARLDFVMGVCLASAERALKYA